MTAKRATGQRPTCAWQRRDRTLCGKPATYRIGRGYPLAHSTPFCTAHAFLPRTMVVYGVDSEEIEVA